MWVCSGWRQGHQGADFHDTNLEVWKVLPQEIDGRKRFERRAIAGAGHHNIRIRALIRAGPLPDSDSRRAVLYSCVDIEPLQRRLLAGDNQVHIMPAAQAVIGHRKKTIGVRRQIEAPATPFLVAALST